MKYFFDTEFIEGFHKPLFGKRRHFIDLISIGIVAEDGREYYGISKEFRERDASQWVKDNVISKLPERRILAMDDVWQDGMCEAAVVTDPIYKSNKQIAREIITFVSAGDLNPFQDNTPTEFYAYYADYDWVLFCSLFGTMMDLPKGFPMYCRDLKQMIDEKAKTWDVFRDVMKDNERLDLMKKHKDYPKQENEHDALDDARWNKRLYRFLQDI